MAQRTTQAQLVDAVSYVDLITGAPVTGTTLDRTIWFKSETNTVAGFITLYIYNGSIRTAVASIPVPLVAVSSTIPGFERTFTFSGTLLPDNSWKLQAKQSVVNTIDVLTEATDV
jgi:hypothetical protein